MEKIYKIVRVSWTCLSVIIFLSCVFSFKFELFNLNFGLKDISIILFCFSILGCCILLILRMFKEKTQKTY